MTLVAVGDRIRRWAFAASVVSLAAAASTISLTSTGSRRDPDPGPPRPVHNPLPGAPESALRNPFLTGGEWRARLREQLEPTRAPSPTALAPSAHPSDRPVEPDLVLLGTYIAGSSRYAVMPAGKFPVGARVGRYKIESVDMERVVFIAGGKRTIVKVPDTGGVSAISTSAGP